MDYNNSICMIQTWWKSISSNRCRKCGNITNQTIFMCQECYMDRHMDSIPDEIWIEFEQAEEEAKQIRLARKRALGLIP